MDLLVTKSIFNACDLSHCIITVSRRNIDHVVYQTRLTLSYAIVFITRYGESGASTTVLVKGMRCPAHAPPMQQTVRDI